MNKRTINPCYALTTSNPIASEPTQSQPVQSRRPGLPFSQMTHWCGLLLSALLLLLVCGSASAQLVNVVSWTNGQPALSNNNTNWTVADIDLDDSTTVYVVGFYGDQGPASIGYTNVTFGGVPPTGLMNISAAGETRSAIAYWITPNTAPGQSLLVEYVCPSAAYWAYQLSNVDTNAPVATSGAKMTFSTSTSVTTSTNNSFVISFYSVNNPSTGNPLTPNPPLIQTGTTFSVGGFGHSMSSATYTAPTPGLVSISWNSPNPPGTANRGVGAVAFVPQNVGAPIVAGSISPALTAEGGEVTLTVNIDPFHSGTVTNVSVNLSSIGGPSSYALVQASSPDVWTNSFIVPAAPPLGTTPLVVTAIQDTAPFTGTGSVPINISAPTTPVIAQDTLPSGLLNMYVGQGVRFSASFAAPGTISYYWQKGDGNSYTNITGATNTTYTIPSVTLSDASWYRLQASNFLGAAESTPVQIAVNDAAPAVYIWSAPIPFAGLTAEQILTNFPAANKIAGAMVAQSSGNPITVTLTNAGSQPVVFAKTDNWASLSGGDAYVSNLNTNKTGNSTFDSVLNAGYNNGAARTITLGGLVVGKKYQVQLFALDDRPNLTPAGSLQFSSYLDPADFYGITSQPFAMADNAYLLGTFTASSNVMTFQQNLVQSAGNLNALVLRSVGWVPPPYFIVQPKSTNNFLGTTVSLTGSAAADTTIASPTITYQWASGPVGGPYLNNLAEGSKYAGVTNTTLIVSNLEAGDGDLGYVLKATDGGGTTTSREARIYVQALPVPPPTNSFAGAVLALTNVPNTRLIGLWPLNETNDPSSGLLFAHDASGKGRSGTYGVTSSNGFNGVLSPQPPTYGGFATNQGALQTGGAGTSDVTSVVNLPPLYITNGVATTICMWINPSGLAGSLSGLLYNRGADQCGFGFAANVGPNNQRNLGFVWNNLDGEATYNYNSGLFPVNDIWNFVVLVMQTNAATFYLNYVDTNGAAFFGKAADTAARYSQNAWSGGPIWIGGDSLGNGAGLIFPGRIANVAVFNSALTDDQIYDLFVSGFQTTGFPAGFTQQPPASQTNYAGYTVRITAQSGGTKPITNQWKFNGVDVVDGWSNGSLISGSQSNVLTIAYASTNWQGVFNLAVTNALGGSVSSNSSLTILTPVAPPPANLVGHWFNGADSLADHSGNLPGTHDAYGVGASATNHVFTNNVPPGKSGSSLRLFGGTSMGISNSWIGDSGYVSTFDEGITNSFTVALWARGQPGVWNPFVSKNGETEGWQLRRSAGQNAVFTMRGTGGTIDPTGAAGGSGADGAWHHYVGTYDWVTGVRTLYVDGVVQNVSTGDGPYLLSTGSRLVLGGRSTPPNADITGTANFTGGMLYDVRIYNTAISGIEQAYLAVPPPMSPPPITISSITPPSGGNPGEMVLSWLTGGKLLQATELTGPWITNQSAVPPYTIIMTNNPAEFYRVLFP